MAQMISGLLDRMLGRTGAVVWGAGRLVGHLEEAVRAKFEAGRRVGAAATRHDDVRSQMAGSPPQG